MGPLKQMGFIRLHFLGISHISQFFLQCMKSSLTLHEEVVQLSNLSMQFSSIDIVVKVSVELVDADVVNDLVVVDVGGGVALWARKFKKVQAKKNS